MARVSVRSAVRKAQSEEKATVKQIAKESRFSDSFQNPLNGIGMGTNNASSGRGYGYNPLSRQRVRVEWMHRRSWIAGVAVDAIPDDMTRAGVDIHGDLEPDQIEKIEERVQALRLWSNVNHAVKAGRLYGGAIAVHLIDGQDFSSPLRIETVGKGQYRGMMVLDRWMVTPSLERLVTELGPNLGTPEFYRVTEGAPALRGTSIHYSRCARFLGDHLPYWQALSENLWGMSVLERIEPLVLAFDEATQGTSQLLAKSYLRYLKIDGYHNIMGSNDKAAAGLQRGIDMMRFFGTNEGVATIDAKDDIITVQNSSFGGISDCLLRYEEQIGGAVGIPLVKMFGQAPAGLNSTGESDLRNYYDKIKQLQMRDLFSCLMTTYQCVAQSLDIRTERPIAIAFRPLWQLSEAEKTDIAQKTTATVLSARGEGLTSDKTTLQELQRVSKLTGVWGTINDEEIERANDVVAAPFPALPDETDPEELKE